MQKQALRFFVVSVFLIPRLSFSQTILAPNANYSTTASYNNADSLFVFNADNSSNLYLLADTINFPTGGHVFEWSEYSLVDSSYHLHSTGTQVPINPLQRTQGFLLTITGDSVTTVDSSACWTMMNDFTFEILTKDANNDILKDALTSSDCIFIGYIEGDYRHDTLVYYHPIADTALYLDLSYLSSFETDGPLEDGVGQMREVDPLNGLRNYVIEKSYWKDRIYTITITDDAGLSREDDINVTAIRPKAIMIEPVYIELDDSIFYPDRSDAYYSAYGNDNKVVYGKPSAPALFRFESESENADSLVWYLDDADTTVITTNSDTTLIHKYRKYGEHNPWLVAINYFDWRTKECADTAEAELIEINSPELYAPNVFTPPGGENPIWRYNDITITDFELSIYNRYGRRVHHYEGNIRYWDGWDGRANNSSNYVSTGVYYYVLKDFSHASLYNEEYYETERPDEDMGLKKGDTIYNGFIHVFNTDEN